MDTRSRPPPRGASSLTVTTVDIDITDVEGRLESQWRKRALLLAVYVLAVLSKRFVLPALSEDWFWRADVAYFALLPLLLLAWGWRKPDWEMDELGARITAGPDEVTHFTDVVNGVWLFLLVWPLAVAVTRLVGDAMPGLASAGLTALLPTFSYAEHMPQFGLWRGLAMLYLSLSAAVVEEFFFRKALRQVLRRVTPSKLVFVPVSALVFGLAHWGLGLVGMACAFAAGLLLAACYAWQNRLTTVMVAHFLVDMVMFR
jgi:membrane protease YdiL (CAAX protease family)